jgi:hypothetical protein
MPSGVQANATPTARITVLFFFCFFQAAARGMLRMRMPSGSMARKVNIEQDLCNHSTRIETTPSRTKIVIKSYTPHNWTPHKHFSSQSAT